MEPKKRVLDHEKPELIAGIVCADSDEPDLMRDVFPYDEVPRIDFDHKLLPIDPAEDIFITDTTFRDGQQARPPYTVKQIENNFRNASPPFRPKRGRSPVRVFPLHAIKTGRRWTLVSPKGMNIRR